jgi:hypothetical protein
MPKDATIESSAEWHWRHYDVRGTRNNLSKCWVCYGRRWNIMYAPVSEKTYGSTTEKLLYGIGQGSCASPILWALINQILLAALGEKFTCIRLVAIDGKEEHIRPDDSFVDDTTTGTNNHDSEIEPVSHVISDLTSSEETLIAKMEESMHFFLHPLQVTGGDLTPKKCVWYLISHR